MNKTRGRRTEFDPYTGAALVPVDDTEYEAEEEADEAVPEEEEEEGRYDDENGSDEKDGVEHRFEKRRGSKDWGCRAELSAPSTVAPVWAPGTGSVEMETGV